MRGAFRRLHHHLQGTSSSAKEYKVAHKRGIDAMECSDGVLAMTQVCEDQETLCAKEDYDLAIAILPRKRVNQTDTERRARTFRAPPLAVNSKSSVRGYSRILAWISEITLDTAYCCELP